MSHTDKHLTEAIHNVGKTQLTLWKLLSAYGIYAFVFFFLGVWFANDWDAQTFAQLCLSVGITLFITFAIRYTVKRPRPNFLSTGYVPALKKYSFPSAHAATGFSLATAIALVQLSAGLNSLGLVTAVVLFGLAVLISVSRVMVGVHYLSDILFGAGLGTFVSFAVIYFV
jgi:undecaprenyl-diphosphatase